MNYCCNTIMLCQVGVGEGAMIPGIAMRSASEGEGLRCHCCSGLALQGAPLRPLSGVLDSAHVRPRGSASETGLGRLAVPIYSYERLGTSRRRTIGTSRSEAAKQRNVRATGIIQCMRRTPRDGGAAWLDGVIAVETEGYSVLLCSWPSISWIS